MRARRVLLTVSGTIPRDLGGLIAAGQCPRPDYHAMAEAMDADLLDHVRARERSGRFGRLLERVAGRDVMLAWVCFRVRRQYALVFTDGEQVGLPFAMLLRLGRRRATRHFMIAHILTTTQKRWFFRLLRPGPAIDRMFVYASRQRELIAEQLGYPIDRIVLTTFAVDCSFWDRERVSAHPRRMICSAGLELRDYPTMISAVDDLEVEVILAAASPWSKRVSNAGAGMQSHVTVTRLDFLALRQAYADARLVVVPLQENDFQAGITTILEAMAMGRPIVCTRTRGQTDTIVDGETGLYVSPGDADELRSAIIRALDDDMLSSELAERAAAWVRATADVGEYARRLAAEVEAELARARGSDDRPTDMEHAS